MAPSKDAEVEAATQVLRRHYRQDWVMSMAANLIERTFNGEIDDEEALHEAIDQDVDNALIYTKDQYLVLFASEDTEAGLEALRDMGNQISENFPAPWAFTTLQHDLNDVLQRSDLLQPMRDGMDADARLDWLVENYGKLFYRRSELTAYFIGVVNEGQTDEIDFGVLLFKGTEPSFTSPSQVAKGKEGQTVSVAWDAFQDGNGEGDSRYIDEED